MDDPDILFAIVILVIVAIVNSLHLDHCDQDRRGSDGPLCTKDENGLE
jgi:hypothetical protein